MTEQEREHVIELLVLITGYSRTAFLKWSDKQLLEHYEKQLGGRS